MQASDFGGEGKEDLCYTLLTALVQIRVARNGGSAMTENNHLQYVIKNQIVFAMLPKKEKAARVYFP